MSDDPLDQINRFVVALLALALMFGAALAAALAWGAPDASIGRIEDVAGWLRDHNSRDARLILTLVAVVVALLSLTVMIAELTPAPQQKMRVRNVKSGAAVLTTKAIAERIEADVREVEHVAQCQAIVVARGKRVEVLLDLHVDSGADLARTADEACRRAHLLVEQSMGVELVARPRARMHYRELRLKDDGTPRPPTGWERPDRGEGNHDERRDAGTPEETQGEADRAAGT